MNKKLYVYICICMVATLLFSCFTVGAASITPTWSVGYPNASAVFLSSYTVEYDLDSTENPYPHGDYCVATYEINMPIFISLGGDSYINGYSSAGVTFAPITPTGYTYRASEIYFESYNIDNVSSFLSAGSNSSASTYGVVRCIFDNYFSHGITIGIGQVTARFTYSYPVTPNNLPDPISKIACSTTISGSITQLSSTPNPDTQGFVAGIITAINNSYIAQDITEMKETVIAINDLLTALKSQQVTQYTNLLTALNASNTWIQILNDVVGDIEEKLIELYGLVNSIDTSTNNIEAYTLAIRSYTSTLKDLMSNFPTYSAKVLEYLGKLAEMSAEQATEAAAIESEYADIKDQQDAANTVVKNVPRPSAPEINISDLTDQQTRQTFNAGLMTILSFPFIERLLIIVFTFATVGFILYGRKK